MLELLRSKDILAATQRDGVWVFTMKKAKFNVSIEIAHVRGMLATLYGDPMGLAIKAEIEGGIADKKTKRKTKYPTAWAQYTATFRLLAPWYGSQVLDGNEYLAVCYEASPYKLKDKAFSDPKAMPLVFQRDAITGELLVHRGCVRGFFKGLLRHAGMSPYTIDLIGASEIRIKPEKPLTVSKRPIQRTGGQDGASGAGFGFYETLFPGEVVTLPFSAPTKNYLAPDQMEKALRHYLKNPARSMSPARGTETGSAELLTLTHEILDYAPEPQEGEEGPTN